MDAANDCLYVPLSSGANEENRNPISTKTNNGSFKSFFYNKSLYSIYFVIILISLSVLTYSATKNGKSISNDVKDKIANKHNLTLDQVSTYENEYREYCLKYNKNGYGKEQFEESFSTYVGNRLKIDAHNCGDHTWTMGINQFTDMSQEEFSQMLGYRSSKKELNEYNPLEITREILYQEKPDDLPESVDWRIKGCVTPAENQEHCGSCWAFSAIGALEGAYCIKYGKLLRFSEQQLVDCAWITGNKGCSGGDMDHAFAYVMKYKEICTEKQYPYTGHQRPCKADKCTEKVKVLKIVDIPHKNLLALKSAVYSQGPISVAVEADAWQFYSSGIYNAPCGHHLDHGVLVVGYGKTNETDYWIIKNSWGTSWGESGFINLAMKPKEKYGECGILLDASFPVVA